MSKALEKLDEKVDKVKDDVNEVKIHVAQLKVSQDNTNKIIEEHVAGDNKIITQLEPILPQLAEMVEDHAFRKESGKRKIEKAKKVALYLGIASTTVGLLIGILKITGQF